MSKASIIRFLAVLLLASWAVQGVMLYCVHDPESDAAIPWLISLMFVPTIAAVIYRFGFNRAAFRHVTLRPGNPLYVVLGALIPAATAFAVLAVVILTGWGGSQYVSFIASGAEVVKGPWLLGAGSQAWPLFALNVAVTAVAFAAVNSVSAVGEEFGWRGFLQRHMIDQFGVTRGVALLGVVWAFWHLPTLLAGYNHPETPILGGFVLFPILLTADSFVMAWLTIRARSFWPAVLMHGSINGIHEGICQRIDLSPGIGRIYVDVVAIVASMVVGAVCLRALIVGSRAPAGGSVSEGTGSKTSQ